MDDETQIKRGAEAGWALGVALKEVGLGDLAIKAAIAALTLILASEPAAACHRFSRWHYPWAQRCSSGAFDARTPRLVRIAVREIEPAPQPPARAVEPIDDDPRVAAVERLKIELAIMAVGGKLTATNDFTAGGGVPSGGPR